MLLKSDNPELVHAFHMDYQWFETNHKKDYDIHICLTEMRLQINHKQVDLSDHPTPVHYAFQVIVSEIMSSLLEDFYLIHAGVVKKEDTILIFSGPPGIGKSTLVKECVNNGWTFFSDDCAPLHKRSGLIYPFPRSMWIVDSSDAQKTSSVRSKHAIPVHQFNQKLERNPEKPEIIICLTGEHSGNHMIHLNLSLKSSENPLIDGLRRINTIHIQKRHHHHAEYRMSYNASDDISKTIHHLCTKHKQDLWHIYRVNPSRSCFDQQSSITKVSPHQAAATIIPEMKLFDSFLNPTKKESSMTSLITISKHFEHAHCYHMTNGTLASEYRCIISTLS